MSKDMFGNTPTSIPKDSREIVRVAFDEQEMGARKSFVPKLGRNKLVVQHVKQGS